MQHGDAKAATAASYQLYRHKDSTVVQPAGQAIASLYSHVWLRQTHLLVQH